MKKIFNYLAVMLLLVAGFTACDKDGEMDEDLVGYYTLSTAFVYPIQGESNYHILLNNDTVYGSAYVGRTGEPATLKVIEKGQTEPELTQEITLTADETIQFIKLPGQPVAIYEADKYTQATLNVVYAQTEDPALYTLFFGGMAIDNNRDFYLRTDQLTDILEIKKDDETVYSQEITLEPAVTTNYLQISATEYATLPIEDLPAPPATNSYVRFFFFPADMNGATQLELTTYYLAADRVFTEKAETVILNSGEISHYFLYDFATTMSDGQRKFGVSYDLKNLDTGEVLAEKIMASAIGRGTTFKFGTAQIKNNGLQITVPIRER